MASVYHLSFDITDLHADCFGRLKPSSILYFVQEAAGKHWQHIEGETQQACSLYWVIIRHRVQISRLPRRGETIRLETWPMPTTRVAYPRSVVAYDANGGELFRSISLWVLMDPQSRAMVLPGKSGITVNGILQGGELPSPASLAPVTLADESLRTVRFTDLDVNDHMNNARYLDWLMDLLPGSFHKTHVIRDMTLGYMAEATEGDGLLQQWQLEENGHLRLEILRPGGEKNHRIFGADVQFDADFL